MTVLSRGARSRRGARRPGWLLLTVLLVLAIAASSALVFTSRVELLKLAVILALWAAVVAAFVSVIYRRQADADAARARDLKLVYDLQLDREISARREYELTVEAQLRRELASELRAQAADEVAALRAELAALRNNLEILFETELADRPAIETERTTVRAYSDWERDTEVTDPGHGPTVRLRHGMGVDPGENGIIDVPEEPLVRRQEAEPAASGRRHAREYGGDPGGWMPAQEQVGPDEVGRSADGEWSPAPAEGQWLPPGVPGSNWVSSANGDMAENGADVGDGGERGADAGEVGENGADTGEVGENGAGVGEVGEAEAHAGEVGENGVDVGKVGEAEAHAGDEGERRADAESGGGYPPGGRHATGESVTVAGPGHHRVEAPVRNSHHGEGQGQSVAELLARLQATPTGGGRRRRRED